MMIYASSLPVVIRLCTADAKHKIWPWAALKSENSWGMRHVSHESLVSLAMPGLGQIWNMYMMYGQAAVELSRRARFFNGTRRRIEFGMERESRLEMGISCRRQTEAKRRLNKGVSHIPGSECE